LTFRFIRIDDALRADHYYLTTADECYCLGDYHPHSGYQAGSINNLISNFKKPVDRRGRPEYRYKEQAITDVGRYVREGLRPEALPNCTFIPIPPSKAKSDPLYDDRAVRALRSGQPPLDVRELILMRQSTRAHHEYEAGEKRPTPEGLYELLAIDPSCLKAPLRQTVVIFDDLLTTGTHFKACQRLVRENTPAETRVIGLFIGRRRLPSVEEMFEDLTGGG
jgi:hypothetical protein